MKQDGINRLLNSQEIGKLSGLAVGSRFTVEGSLQGAHRSLLKGFSMEFADYRQYVPGDDLRRLDWRVFGRNERLYIRQYEQECNLRVNLLVDGSKSMTYHDDGRISKFTYAAKLAAALAYLTIQQQDSVGLTLFDSKIRFQQPPGAGAEHLRILSNRLADFEPDNVTDVAQTLHALAEKMRRRGLVILLSDLFDDLPRIRQALAHFRRRRHDVIVYHVLDSAEMEFSFRGDSAFEDLETGEVFTVAPQEVRKAYLESFNAFLLECRSMCASMDVDYIPCDTGQPLFNLVRQHLTRRQKRGR